jgi:hypothetical protein
MSRFVIINDRSGAFLNVDDIEGVIPAHNEDSHTSVVITRGNGDRGGVYGSDLSVKELWDRINNKLHQSTN